ncbi:MAG: tetratricopeptide repeat protein, partial [bacterium]
MKKWYLNNLAIVPGLILFSLLVFSPAYGQGLFDFSARRMQREFQAGIALLQEGEHQLARRQFNNFLKNYNDTGYRARAFYGIGEAFYAEDNYDSALEYYADALSEAPLNKIRTHTALERGLRSARERDNAGGRELISFLENNPDSYAQAPVSVAEAVARFYLQLGEEDDYQNWADRYHRANPAGDTWTVKYARFELDNENYERVLELTDKVLADSGSHHSRARFLRAEAYYMKENLEEALENYQQVAGDPEYGPLARYGIAWVEIDRGNLKQAREHLQELAGDTAVKIRGKAYRDLARLQREEENFAAAVEAYKRAVKLLEEPASSKLRLELGDYLLEAGEDERAIEQYRQARVEDPETNKFLIRAFATRNNYDSVARRLARMDPEERKLPEWRYYRGLVEYNRDNYQKAREIVPAAEEVGRNLKTRVLKLRGAINYELKNYEAARKDYDRWLEIEAAPGARYYRALLAKIEGETKRARTSWQELVEEETDEPWFSRSAYHLADLALAEEDFARFDRWAGKIKPANLTGENRLNFSLLKYRRAKAEDKSDSRLTELVEESARIATEEGFKETWLEFFLQNKIKKSIWAKELIPRIAGDSGLIVAKSSAVLAELHKRGWEELALKAGADFLQTADLPYESRQTLLLEQMNQLVRMGRYEKVGDYLPAAGDWKDWQGEKALQLGLNLARYYRQTG